MSNYNNQNYSYPRNSYYVPATSDSMNGKGYSKGRRMNQQQKTNSKYEKQPRVEAENTNFGASIRIPRVPSGNQQYWYQSEDEYDPKRIMQYSSKPGKVSNPNVYIRPLSSGAIPTQIPYGNDPSYPDYNSPTNEDPSAFQMGGTNTYSPYVQGLSYRSGSRTSRAADNQPYRGLDESMMMQNSVVYSREEPELSLPVATGNRGYGINTAAQYLSSGDLNGYVRSPVHSNTYGNPNNPVQYSTLRYYSGSYRSDTAPMNSGYSSDLDYRSDMDYYRSRSDYDVNRKSGNSDYLYLQDNLSSPYNNKMKNGTNRNCIVLEPVDSNQASCDDESNEGKSRHSKLTLTKDKPSSSVTSDSFNQFSPVYRKEEQSKVIPSINDYGNDDLPVLNEENALLSVVIPTHANYYTDVSEADGASHYPTYTVKTSFDDNNVYSEIDENRVRYSSHHAGVLSPSRFRSLCNTPTNYHYVSPTTTTESAHSPYHDTHAFRNSIFSADHQYANDYVSVSPRSVHPPSNGGTPVNRQSATVSRKSSMDIQANILRYPIYRKLWNKIDRQQMENLMSRRIAAKINGNEEIKHIIERAIEKKKICYITQARTMFLELALCYPNCMQIWIEFCRLEMECGEYENARIIVDCALQQFPRNELLLQKKMKIEEKLRNIDGLTQVVNELNQSNNQKAVKIMIEAVMMIAKAGYEQSALEYYMSITNNPHFLIGNFYLEYLLFEEHCGSFGKLLSLIPQGLSRFPKYGPLWFYCFDLYEVFNRLLWDESDMTALFVCREYDIYMERAICGLTSDILWKVFFVRMQLWLKCLYLIRLSLQSNIEAMAQYNSVYQLLMNRTKLDLSACIQQCPSNLIWKVYITISRLFAISGYRKLAIITAKHCIKRTPAKSLHQVYLDFAKTYYFCNYKRETTTILQHSMYLFPDEWKLVLEKIQQLIMNENYIAAYALNKEALQKHVGAGRLWSSFIQLSHMLFGPHAALLAFRQSLYHVAKSGEVWCEAARIYLNPTSSLFHPLNASKCINFAVFFTPQYGDSYIEALRLMLISSDAFYQCHSCSSISILLPILLSNPSFYSFIKRSSFADPNYGQLWFRCKENMMSTTKEVLYRSMSIVANEVCKNVELYYDACYRYMLKKENQDTVSAVKESVCNRCIFSNAFKPDYLYNENCDRYHFNKRVKVVYGASQVDN